MSDEGFHEIQLNGKQLVFLFMAATVVAVVIFLCGVMVGRGVPTRAASSNESPDQAALDPTAALGTPGTQTPGTEDAPLTTQETLTYPALLEDPNPPVEILAPRVDTPSGVPSSGTNRTGRPEAAAPVPAKPTAPPQPTPGAAAAKPVTAVPTRTPAEKSTALAEPAGTGFVVQVAAVRQRAEADTIARRLTGKGYPAFVTTAGANFRVRVGKFTDRRQAETVAARLEREEQFKPWITR
jgi:cell division septation protein DedD